MADRQETPTPTPGEPAKRRVKVVVDLQPVVDALATFLRSWIGRCVLAVYLLWPVVGGEQIATWITALGADGVAAMVRGAWTAGRAAEDGGSDPGA